jgi:hypothetical protein
MRLLHFPSPSSEAASSGYKRLNCQGDSRTTALIWILAADEAGAVITTTSRAKAA